MSNNDDLDPDVVPLPADPDTIDLPDTARLLLKSYAGPVLVVGSEGIVAYNQAGQQISLNARLWWREVQEWLENTKSHGTRSPLMVKIPSEGGLMTIEWTSLTLGSTDKILLLGRNITLERNLHEVLSESRDRFRDLVELSADLAWETKPDGTFGYIAGGKALGYQPEQLLGKRARDFVIRQPLENADYFDSNNSYTNKETYFRKADGSAARVLISSKPLLTKAGEWRGMRGICRDITDVSHREAELARLQRRDRLVAQFVRSLRDAQEGKAALTMATKEIGSALEAAGCRIYKVDDRGQFAITAEWGMAPPEIVNAHNRTLKDTGRFLLQDVSPNAVLLGSLTQHSGKVTGAIWVWRPAAKGEWHDVDQTLLSEVTEHLGIALAQFEYQERLRILSECDGLTKLLNRNTFMDKLTMRLREDSVGSALFYVDLDNFKAVNDTHGHKKGDEAIRRVADILRSCQQDVSDLAGRIGGDEFVLWVNNLSRQEAEKVAAQLVKHGAEDLKDISASAEKPLGMSVGVGYLPPKATLRPASLLELADQAMYAIKHHGKSDWKLIDAFGGGG